MLSLAQIAALAFVQGMAELLPVSSSAHVIIAETLMGVDPSSPQMTFLLVMLHTGTTFAVILYFRKRWLRWLTGEGGVRPVEMAKALALATAATGVVGLALKHLIETVFLRGAAHAEVEALFSNLPLIAASLAAAGALIVWSSRKEDEGGPDVDLRQAAGVGVVQGLCLPFRGFSRSGATISAGLLGGVSRAAAEDFSFALAVILTPPVVARELWRLHKASAVLDAAALRPGLLGMAISFAAGLLALRWLSNWLENGRWRWFGYYCFAASAGVLLLSRLR